MEPGLSWITEAGAGCDDEKVNFEAGEPICMIVLSRRGEVAVFEPEIREMDAEGVPGRLSE